MTHGELVIEAASADGDVDLAAVAAVDAVVERDAVPRRARAYSLVVVLLTLGLVIVAITTLVAFLEIGVRTSSDSVERRRMFYVCDGMTRIVGEAVRGFLQTASLDDRKDGAGALQAYLTRADVGGGADLPRLMPAGFSLQNFNIDSYDHVGDAVPIPSGTFAGMLGQEDKLRLTLRAKRNDERFHCEVVQNIALTQIGLFQMTSWTALPKTRLWFVTFGTVGFKQSLQFIGRVHGQGAVDVGVGPLADLDQALITDLSAAGRLSARNCPGVAGVLTEAPKMPKRPLSEAEIDALMTGDGASKIATEVAGGRYLRPLASSCDDTIWLSVSGASSVNQTTEQLSDVRLGAQPLRLPVPEDATTADDPLRVLIEPVTGDAASDGRERFKYAYKADIRIIDGVWYLAAAENPGDFPGKPIWSDHPGHAVDPFGNSVGQADLFGEDGERPRLFSAYGMKKGGVLVGLPTDRGTVVTPALTYGALSSELHGSLPTSNGVLNAGPTSVACGGAIGGTVALDTMQERTDKDCPGDHENRLLLESARIGFQDPTLTVRSANRAVNPPSVAFNEELVKESVGNIAPINFSVAGFQRALASRDKDELGSYFDAGRPFNGVVWISSRWPGAWETPAPLWPAPATAMPTTTTTAWTSLSAPGQDLAYKRGGASVGNGTPFVAHPALPYPLCSLSLGGTPVIDADHQIPSCLAPEYTPSRTTPTGPLHAAYPNAVRIVNASELRLPLTIATNLPAFLVGDANTSSPSALTPVHEPDKNWRPFAVAADNVALLSPYFADVDHPWWNRANISRAFPTSATVSYHVAILSGVAAGWDAEGAMCTSSGCGGCDDEKEGCRDDYLSALRILEPFGVESLAGNYPNLDVNGSVVVGYHARSVNPAAPFAFHPIKSSSGVEIANWAINTRIAFDHSLGTVATQPPGTEALGLTAVRQWERD